MQAAQAALDDFSACLEAVQNGSKKQSLTSLPYYQGGAMHALCQANEALGTVIDQLYAKMQEQAADPMKMGAVQEPVRPVQQRRHHHWQSAVQ